MPIFALSTSWCSHRHTDGYAMLREMADLGFEYVELSHGVRITLVPGILRAVEDKVVKIATAHNFCPLPTGIQQSAPNLFEPSTADAREHDQWLRHTRRSIDFSAQLKARVLVCHLGSVRFFWFNPENALHGFTEKNPKAEIPKDPKYQAVLARAITRLKKRAPAYWNRVIASIREVEAYALEKGVRLGFENREKFDELPIDDEFGALFEALGEKTPGGYWHDTGHANLKERLGVLQHREHLEKNAARLLGFHLHDVNEEGDDHQAIGTGKVDFEMISQFWKPHHVLVLELSPRIPVEAVVDSKRRIDALIAASRLARAVPPQG